MIDDDVVFHKESSGCHVIETFFLKENTRSRSHLASYFIRVNDPEQEAYNKSLS
jgi:hypothetical protein